MPTTSRTLRLTGPLGAAALRRAAALLTVVVDAEARERLARGRRLFRALQQGEGGEGPRI